MSYLYCELCEFNNTDNNLWKYLTEDKIENYTTGYYIKKCYEDSDLFIKYGIKSGDILIEIDNNKTFEYRIKFFNNPSKSFRIFKIFFD